MASPDHAATGASCIWRWDRETFRSSQGGSGSQSKAWKRCPSPYASRQRQCGNSQRLTLEILIRLPVASDIRHLGNMTVLSAYLTPMPASGVFTPPVQFELCYPEKPFL